MTKGGAISDLNNLLKADDIPTYYKPSTKTIIETIEMEQSNSNEDCISRKDAEMCLTANITNMTIEEYISMVGDRLKGLSSIQPKPKTDVLDKIRAEIKEESRFCPFTEGLERALEIIDKYKAESEDKECR